jgi:hypothetical protein
VKSASKFSPGPRTFSLHSELGYRPPEEFEEESKQQNVEARSAASTVTFDSVIPSVENHSRACLVLKSGSSLLAPLNKTSLNQTYKARVA